MKKSIQKISFGLLSLFSLDLVSQTTIVTADYNKALWMTTRFFGAQRSTDIDHAVQQDNWLVQGHLPSGVNASKTGIMFAQDADGAYELSGGWFDCGDHVFFGQTGFYAGYMLAKAYDAFPEGFDDYYDASYSGYKNSGDYTWEGGKGSPNGIPDALDELKHATDFFIKCARNSTTFYFEKGDGDADHTQRVTAVKMQTNSVSAGGELRKMWSNPEDASMPAMCSATLALMSKLYRPYNAVYADLCLTHAKFAYDYSKSKTGSVPAASGSFYSGNENFQNGRAIMFSELFRATNLDAYKTEALALSAGISTGSVRPNTFYTFDYSNTGEMALYCLAEIGHPNARTSFNTHISNKFIDASNYNAAGIYKNGGGWGKLRYVGNAAFLVALYNKLNNSATLDSKVFSNVDYILGKNSGSWSYIVGFSPLDNTPVVKAPTQPHHRNLFLYDGNNNDYVAPTPIKNKQFGALVGGALDGTFVDLWTDYVNTEVCVDYNVGIVGALAAIKKQKDPVDISKFGVQCSTPKLGNDKSLCGSSNLVLNSGLTNNNIRTFEWFKNGVSQGIPSKTATTFTITTGGEWSVKVDSLNKCSKTASIIISATLPAVNLGSNVNLCSPSSVVLNSSIIGAGISHTWAKNNVSIPNSNLNSLSVSEAGTYKVTVSASGCPSTTDEVVVTSSLPTTMGGVFCPTSVALSKAQLYVTSGTGPYDWYATTTSTTKLTGTSNNGKTFEVSPTETTTYFVKDASSFTGTLGPIATSGTFNAWGEQGFAEGFYLKFTPTKTFDINAISIPFNSIYSDGSAVVGIEIRNANGELKGTFTSNSRNFTASTTSALYEFTFPNFRIESSWGNELFMCLEKNITNVAGQLGWNQSGTFVFPYTLSGGAVSITGANTQGQSGNNYVYFYNWKVSSGSECDRVPVIATRDCNVGLNGIDTESSIKATIYPNPVEQTAFLSLDNNTTTKVEVFSLTGVLVDSLEAVGNVTFGQNLPSGTYIVRLQQGNTSETLKFNKR